LFHSRSERRRLNTSTPTVGGELWTLLGDYRLQHVQKFKGYERRRSALAMLAMCVEQIIAIDDIDPSDVFNDYEQYHPDH
jgi:hypothetical protein